MFWLCIWAFNFFFYKSGICFLWAENILRKLCLSTLSEAGNALTFLRTEDKFQHNKQMHDVFVQKAPHLQNLQLTLQNEAGPPSSDAPFFQCSFIQ